MVMVFREASANGHNTYFCRMAPNSRCLCAHRYLFAYQITDNFGGGFLGSYCSRQKPVCTEVVNGYGTSRLAPLTKKARSVGTGNGRVFRVIFIPVIGFFFSHSCHSSH